MNTKNKNIPYQKLSQHGEFYSGDHKSEGGKVVKGINTPIHIQGGVESDIMKAHPKEGEYLLAQRKGYKSLDEVPKNNKTGYNQYGFFGDLGSSFMSALSSTGESFSALWSGVDKYTSDLLQQKFEIGEYGTEAIRNKSLERLLGTSFTDLQKGTEKMLGDEGFIQSQLGEQLTQLDARGSMLDTAYDSIGNQMDITSQNYGRIQSGVGSQMDAMRNTTAKTNLVGSANTSRDIESIEKAGSSGMKTTGLNLMNLSNQMKDIGSQRDILSSQRRQAVTQADIDEYKFVQDAGGAMSSMIQSYMSATGEKVPDEFMSLYEDYLSNYG